MFSRKLISLGLIASQMLVAVPGFCGSDAPLANATPEASLLVKMIAFQADGVATDAWKKETSEALEQYTETAPSTGREARLQQAMVSLGMYTAPQAAEIMATAHAAEARLTSMNNPTQAGAQKATEIELSQILHTAAQGAEFSSCVRNGISLERIGMGAFLIGAFGILAQGGSVPSDNWAAISAFSGFGLALVGIMTVNNC